MTTYVEPIIAKEETPKKKKGKKVSHWKTNLFVFLMLLYPVAQFLIMWFGVNINSIFLTFKTYESGELVWVFQSTALQGKGFFETLFYNYSTLINSIINSETTQSMFKASLVYFIISCLITLPISMLFSYFVFKKILANGFFKVIFFLPSILPLFILTMVYSLSLGPNGLVGGFLGWFGVDATEWLSNIFIGDNAKWAVWIFCIWAGIGYDVILLTAGMSRIPRDILESCKMDGVSPVKEFFKIIIPLTWPTITTLFIFGMMSVFNVTFQPFFLVSGQYDTMTIGLHIYQASTGSGLQEPATLGLFCSIIGAPIIVATRWGMNKCFKDVGF
ncbi:MAG: sugar ABC transporter permease [Bacilli bacterium]|nr:sugar ABC transporter permease [Bacilli bacterium]